MLHGTRGRAPADADAVCAVLSQVSRLAAAHPEISDLEVKPLVAAPGGVWGLDARLVLATPS